MKLFIKLESVWQEITNYVVTSKITISENLMSELKPSSRTVSFSLIKENPVYDDLLASVTDIPFTLMDDTGTETLFSGYLTDDYSLAVNTSGKSAISITAEDAINKKLKAEWVSADGKSTRYKGAKVIDVVRSICSLAGVTFDEMSYTRADLEDPVFLSVSDLDDTQYYDILAPLLLDFGYIFYFEAYGKLSLYSLDTSSVLYIDLIQTKELTVKKTRSRYDEIDVKWKSLKTLTNKIVFDDTTGGTSDSPCVIELAADSWYPEGTTADANTYSDYKIDSGAKVIIADGVTSQFAVEGGITQSFENYGSFAVIKFHNTNVVARKITKLRLHASSVIVEDAQNTTTSLAGGKKKYKYEAKYLNTKTQSERLASVLYNYYANLDYSYTVSSPQKITVGGYVTLKETTMSGITQKCRIIARKKEAKSDLYTYTLQAVGDFSIVETRVDFGTSVSSTEPRFASLDQIRLIEAGDTTTIPDSITSVTAVASKEGITITWPWDGTGLENALKRFRVEISDDGVTWWTIYVTTNRCVYNFNRDTDGYPEASELAPWRVRVKAENMYSKESEFYGPSASGQPVDTTSYGTWHPSVLVVSPYTSGRMAVLSWGAGAQYGQYGYDVQVCRKDSAPLEADWRKPDLSLDPRASEENYTDGTVGALRVTVNQFSQSLPLTNQALNLPIDTQYYYRVRGVSAVPTSASPSAVIVGEWSGAYVLLARPGGTKDLAEASIQKEQIAPSAVTMDALNVLAKNRVNPMTNATLPAPLEGWSMTAGTLSQEVDALVGYPVGKMNAVVARLVSEVFEVGPNEILEVCFHVRAPGTAVTTECCIGDTSGSARRYEAATWGAGTKVWGAFSGSAESGIAHNSTAPLSAAYKTIRTYIVGVNVTPDEIPAPVNNLDAVTRCFRVKQGSATISVVNRAGTGPLYVFAPTILSVSAGIMTASKINVKDLSAISAYLGEVKGGPSIADDDRIVLGDGYEGVSYLTVDVGAGAETYDLGKKGTIKFGGASDTSLFWRVYSTAANKWRTFLRMTTFIVDAIASKIMGAFFVYNADGDKLVFKVNPTSISESDPIEIGSDSANVGGNATIPILKKSINKSVPIMNPIIPYLKSGTRGYTGALKGALVSFEVGAATGLSGYFWDAGSGAGDAALEGEFAIARRGSTLFKLDSNGVIHLRIPTVGGSNFWQVGSKYSAEDWLSILRNGTEYAALYTNRARLLGGFIFSLAGVRRTGITNAGGTINVLDKTSGNTWAVYVGGDRITLYDGTTEYKIPITTDTFPLANLANTAKKLETAEGSAPCYAVRAWLVYNGVTKTVLSSGNIASVTRYSAGRYRVTFSTAMPDVNYAVAGSNIGNSDGLFSWIAADTTYHATTVNGFDFILINNTGGAVDSDHIGLLIIR